MKVFPVSCRLFWGPALGDKSMKVQESNRHGDLLLSFLLSITIFLQLIFSGIERRIYMVDDITKLIDLEDSDLIIEGPAISKGVKVLTVSKRLQPTFCPICGCRMHSRGIYTRMVNHPILQDGTQLVLKLNQRRWKCLNPVCGNTCNDTFSFVDPRRRNTNITDISIVMAFKDAHLSAAQIAKRFSVSDTYAINLFARYVDMPRRQFSDVICVDEVHVNISRVCKYALVIQDFLTGEPIDMIASRRQEVTEPYFAGIPKAERFRVKYLITDMYRPYIGYIDKYFPNAVSIVDSFHVVKMINGKILNYIRRLQNQYRRMDEERHEDLEQQLGRRIDFTHSKEYYLLKNFRWLILKNHDDIHYSGKSRYDYKLRRYITLGEIEDMLFDIDPDLRYIRNLKERYIHFNKKYGNRPREARQHLKDLIWIYRQCPFPLFHEVADSLTYFFESIINSFIMVERMCADGVHISRLSNGPMEAMNHITKDIKRNGHGYSNFEHLRNRFLFSQRENAHVLATPLPIEIACPKTGKTRGPYKKNE